MSQGGCHDLTDNAHKVYKMHVLLGAAFLHIALGDRFGFFIQTLNNAENYSFKLFIQLKKELSPT